MEVNIIKTEGKPLEKLIETVSSAIGTLYKPTQIRKEAKAKAEALIMQKEAEAKGMIIIADANDEIIERTKKRIALQEINRQMNIEDVADRSIKYLSKNVSDTPIDFDWKNRFFNKVQDINNDELKEIWAKILGNEVSNPGNVSIRALELLSNLDKKEAELFEKLASMSVFNHSVLKVNNENSYDQFGITFSDMLVLEAAGLIHSNASLNITYPTIPPFNIAIIQFGNKIISVKKEGENKIVFNQTCFTHAAGELINILKFEHNYNYLSYFIEEKSKQGYVFQYINQ